MKKLILAAMATSLIGAPAFADAASKTNKHEAAGLGSGLAIGAAVGGPVGAILGAAFGAMLGDRYHDERTARVDLETDMALANADMDELRSQLRGRERRIDEMQQRIAKEQRDYRAAVQEALNAEVFFRTGESALSEDSIARIGRIAELVAPMDGFVVQLAGHADIRGAEDFNEQLSAARAVAVRDALIQAGFPASRIAVTAEGERAAKASEEDVDALAMDRRVQIELVSGDTDERVAARP
jgi:outer membrane protein OmpA-like peptidoglycan-associated protein